MKTTREVRERLKWFGDKNRTVQMVTTQKVKKHPWRQNHEGWLSGKPVMY